MKTKTIRFSLFAAALITSAAFAQQKMDEMKGMDMKNMQAKGDMPKEMKGDMKGMDMSKKPAPAAQGSHQAKATVKKVDEKLATVTLAHDPVASLNWPAMTMSFRVKDKALMPKLTAGKRVDVEFVQEGEDYVVKSVK